MTTEVTEFLEDLDAGVFDQNVSREVSDVAMGVVNSGRKVKVLSPLDLAQIGDSQQVNIEHTISFIAPTKRGKRTEQDTTRTPMYVGVNGKVTFFPENQNQLFGKKGEVPSTNS